MFQKLSALALAAAVCSAPAVAGEDWYGDFDVAVEAAKKSGKDLFVDFTGSDWCHWCIKLHEEVLGFDEFVTAAQEDYILVSLDFPRGKGAKAKVPNPKRNEALSQKYDIRGFPTVLLMDVDGIVFGRTGYQKGGVENYLKHMDGLRASGKKMLMASKSAVTAFDAAEGADAKAAAWQGCVKALEELEPGSPFAAPLARAVRWAFEHDKDNSHGMKLRAAKALLEAGIQGEQVRGAVREFDAKNEMGLYERLVEEQFNSVADEASARAAVAMLPALNELGFKNKERGFRLNFLAARWASLFKDREAVEKFVAAARAIGTDEEALLEELATFLEG